MMLVTTGVESMAKTLFIILLANLLNEAIFCQACKLPLSCAQQEIKGKCAGTGKKVLEDGSILDKLGQNIGQIMKTTVGGGSKKDGSLTATVSKSLGDTVNSEAGSSGIDGASGTVNQVGSSVEGTGGRLLGSSDCLSKGGVSKKVDRTLSQLGSNLGGNGILSMADKTLGQVNYGVGENMDQMDNVFAGAGKKVKEDSSILDKSGQNVDHIMKTTVGGGSKKDGSLPATVSKSLGDTVASEAGSSGAVNQAGSSVEGTGGRLLGSSDCLSEGGVSKNVEGTLSQLSSGLGGGGILSETDKTLGQVNYGAGENMDQIDNVLGGIGSPISQLSGITGSVKGGVGGIVGQVGQVGTGMDDKLKVISDDVGSMGGQQLKSLIPGSGGIVDGILDQMGPVVGNIPDSINGVVGGIFNSGKCKGKFHRPKTCY